MSTRGFARGHLAAVGIAIGMAAAVGSQAQAAGQWAGGYIGFKTDFTGINIDYTNPGTTTPEQHLSGIMLGATAGYDVEVGSLVIGIAGDAAFGNLHDFVHDGNYITESGDVKALGAIRGRIGVDMGNFLPYVTGGVMFGGLQQGEICPAPAAAPFGFCSTHGPFDLKQSKTIVGGTIGVGAEYMFARGWTMQAQYLHTFFPETTFTLSPDAKGNPLPDSIAHPSLDQVSLSFIKRF